jgi:HEAT repeat protein
MDDPSNKRDAEVETQITLAETPFGDGPHARERNRAIEWLVAHADRAYPVVLARVAGGRATAAVIDLLPRFAREESIAPLEKLLSGPEPPAWAAGQALARHPQKEAGDALRRLLTRSGASAVVAADALATRGDRGDCAALVAAAGSTDARLRYHAVQAAGTLGCLGRDALQSFERSDTDPDVRGLAAKLLAKRK